MALQWPPVLFLEVTLVIEESEASSCASDVRCAVTEGDLAMMMGASTCAAMGAAPKASNMQGLKQNRANLCHCRSYQSQLVTNRSRPQRSAVRPMRLARATTVSDAAFNMFAIKSAACQLLAGAVLAQPRGRRCSTGAEVHVPWLPAPPRAAIALSDAHL